MVAIWSRMRNARQTDVLHLEAEARRITLGRVSPIAMTAIKQFMVGSSKPCAKFSRLLLMLGLRITGVVRLAHHETGMRLPMSMSKQVYVQEADMWAMELLYPTWLVEHLRIK